MGVLSSRFSLKFKFVPFAAVASFLRLQAWSPGLDRSALYGFYSSNLKTLATSPAQPSLFSSFPSRDCLFAIFSKVAQLSSG
jgi:hypothetical protein